MNKSDTSLTLQRPVTTMAQLLVSHVSDTCSERDLEDLFYKCGDLVRCLINRQERAALIEYKDERDAEDAIKQLDGKVFHKSTLEVEWMIPRARRLFFDEQLAALAKDEATTSIKGGQSGRTRSSPTTTLSMTMDGRELTMRVNKNEHTRRFTVTVEFDDETMFESLDTPY